VLIGLTIPLQIALIPLFMNLRTLGLLNTPFALIGPYTGFGLAFGTFIMKGFFEGLPRELEERRGSTARASSDLRAGDAAAHAPGGRDGRDLLVPAELERVPLRVDLHHRGAHAHASHRDLCAAVERVLRNYPILAASLVLFSVPVLVLYFVFQQQFVEGLTAGALKH
jgi:raffinose/stachyose/melibiose transport system permease protein